LVHGLGTGSDTKLGWVLVINGACAAAVLAALWWRLARGWSVANATRRGAAVLASVALPVAVAVWAVTGPLKPGWARKAGTPTALLGSPAASTGLATPSGGSSGTGTGATAGTLEVPFTANFQGSQQQSGPDANGLVSVTISGTTGGAQSGRLTIVLVGQPAGSGVTLTSSQVTLGTAAVPGQYRGSVTQLSGTTLVAKLTGANGKVVTATAQLQLSSGSTAVAGTLTVAS
jgi:hypothetical protein